MFPTGFIGNKLSIIFTTKKLLRQELFRDVAFYNYNSDSDPFYIRLAVMFTSVY